MTVFFSFGWFLSYNTKRTIIKEETRISLLQWLFAGTSDSSMSEPDGMLCLAEWHVCVMNQTLHWHVTDNQTCVITQRTKTLQAKGCMDRNEYPLLYEITLNCHKDQSLEIGTIQIRGQSASVAMTTWLWKQSCLQSYFSIWQWSGPSRFVVVPPCRELITWLNEQALAMSEMSRGAKPAGSGRCVTAINHWKVSREGWLISVRMSCIVGGRIQMVCDTVHTVSTIFFLLTLSSVRKEKEELCCLCAGVKMSGLIADVEGYICTSRIQKYLWNRPYAEPVGLNSHFSCRAVAIVSDY